jgi:hypothetical protein
MKLRLTPVVWGVLIAVLFFSGCAGTTPPVQTQTPVPTTAVTLTPTPTPVPFPGALALNEYATFGSGERQGKATVYQFEIKSDYNWTSPSWNSPGQQASASQPLGLQRGYTTEKPGAGNAFLFLYARVLNNGTSAVYAPSAQQFVVSGNGKVYNYTPVQGPDVVIDKVAGTQYDYQIGRGGEVGYIQPGESNRAEGYLICEIPAALTPREIYVLVNLDYQNQAVWSLAETNA